ncbi:phosphatidylglycerophosphatase A [Sulfuriflexus sp.]|uniref:phosphatidylglycerophosphatase A family protein n=1 Tax=Sulfuriflexus sp. TaxID=2015443 RepID=UPI0028CC7C8B|nr:phosphatidylglycerophosphatase A [Sulfuriflexus sp.]MDT8403278.1 phosphatidylglycerophosphatase A [Sulfuriflexus sp.]
MSKPASLPITIWRDPLMWLACGFGTGAARFAPGTFGTLVALPFYYFLQPLAAWLYLAVVAVLFIIGIGLCAHAASKLKVHDHPGIVWDEVVGYLVTMFMAPSGWQWMLAGFALFRLFDIWKPWPIRLLDQRVAGGFGIMVDDLLAGIYAAGLLQLGVYLYSL